MASNEYHFTTHWRLEGTVAEVSEVLFDGLALPRWWPSVYLDAEELEPGDPKTHIGRVISLYTKGWLPYTLRWKFRITENQYPSGFSLDAFGDLEGRGIWKLEAEGKLVHVQFDWIIKAEKAILKYLSFMMKPIFAANHEWAMARGEESLRLELARRRAADAATVAAPPGPTFRWAIKKKSRA